MTFQSNALFPGDMFDTALRLAADLEASPGDALRQQASGKWREMLGLGWQGVRVAEEEGGAGAALSDLAAVIEAGAQHGLLAPLADRCAVAPLLLAAAGARPLLQAVAAGQASVCTVLDAGDDVPGATGAARLDDAGRPCGTLRAADLTEPASHVLFNLRAAQAAQDLLAVLPMESFAQRARYYQGVDGRTVADLTLDGLALHEAAILLRGADVRPAVAAAAGQASLLACVEAVGAAGAMIGQTIDYLGTRVQFGVALGTFQVLRHRVVDMYVAYENARGIVRRLVDRHDAGLAVEPRDLVLARLYCSGMGRRLAESTVQLHGGMGMALEMPAARLAMLALSGSLQRGGRSECLDWLTRGALAPTAA